MKFSVVGDIMLSRLIGQKFEETNYSIVNEKVKKRLDESDYIIANLESPILNKGGDFDHLVFNAKKEVLNDFKFIDFFSLANNHINDCDVEGINDTINALKDFNFDYNGAYLEGEEYEPSTLINGNDKFAIFCCTDMMNVPIKGTYKVPNINDDFILLLLKKYKDDGYMNIVYAHMGQLFTRYPNPIIRTLSKKFCDYGADVVLTVHPHVLGGIEEYKEKKIIYSLGDFVMDGSSYRRRRSCIIDFEYNRESKSFEKFKMTPTFVDSNLQTIFAPEKQKKIALKSWQKITNNLKKYSDKNYGKRYKFYYKIEIINHNLSTIRYIIDHKGLTGFFKLIFKRFDEVKMMFRWIASDRSKITKDDDAILEDRKKMTSKELFHEN